jgi:hypothetical protein
MNRCISSDWTWGKSGVKYADNRQPVEKVAKWNEMACKVEDFTRNSMANLLIETDDHS